MKRAVVRVPWEHGLHLRPAARLVRLAARFRSRVILRLGRATADVTSILSIVGLCALMGSPLEVEATGDDEDRVIAEIVQAFSDPADEKAVQDPATPDESESNGPAGP